MKTYKVKDWSEIYENNRTRELKRLDWVPVPNKMDGDGYTELLDHDRGASHLGAWLAIVQIASKCEPRGTLLRGRGKPHDARSLARISRIPANVFEEVLPRLVTDVGWMEVVETNEESTSPHDAAEIPQGDAVSPQEGALSRARAEGNGMEGNGREHKHSGATARETIREIRRPPISPVSVRFEEFWEKWPRQFGRDAARAAWDSVVTPANEDEVFSCLQRFLESGDVARGAIPMAGPSNGKHGWIFDCSRDGWKCNWPKAREPTNKQQENTNAWDRA